MTANPFVEFRDRYYYNAPLFVEEVLGMDGRDADHTIDPDQRQILQWVSDGERRISVRSGHGVGKSTVLSWIIVWFACCRVPFKALCTAPTSGQLFGALAAECKSWFKKLPPKMQELFEIQVDEIKHRDAPDECFVAFGTSKAETPEALAGRHSANMLIIADEASGVPEAVFEASAGSMSGPNAITILAGNPVRTSGLFFDTFHKLRDVWKTLVISCEGHPRISPDYIVDMERRYGRDSNAFRVRVLGEFPTGDDDTVIPFQHVEASLHRDVTPLHVRPVWGVDCARFGNDASALCQRVGNALVKPTEIRKGYDIMQVTGWVKAEWDVTIPSLRPSDILVDSIGLGAGVCDRLNELGLPARGVNVSESAAMTERYINLRAELWFKGKDWFAAKDCNLNGDEALAAELVQPRFKYASNGKLQVESKEDMKKRGVASPNRADAFLLTLAAESVSAFGSSSQRTSWNQPLQRKIAGIV